MITLHNSPPARTPGVGTGGQPSLNLREGEN